MKGYISIDAHEIKGKHKVHIVSDMHNITFADRMHTLYLVCKLMKINSDYLEVFKAYYDTGVLDTLFADNITEEDIAHD